MIIKNEKISAHLFQVGFLLQLKSESDIIKMPDSSGSGFNNLKQSKTKGLYSL